MARSREVKKSKMHQTLASYIRNHAGATERVVIIAETNDEQVHVITNELTFAEIFTLLKVADIQVTQEYLEKDEEE